MMSWRVSQEVWFLALVTLWLLLLGAQSDGVPVAAKDVGSVGVGLGGLALLIRAIAPLLRRDGGSGTDLRFQEETRASLSVMARVQDRQTTVLEGLGQTLAAIHQEHRRTTDLIEQHDEFVRQSVREIEKK